MSNSLRPYHARIFRGYIEYLRTHCHWTDAKVGELLDRVNVSKHRLADEGSWFDLDFADRFYSAVVEMTGDQQIAFHAGRFIKMTAMSATFYYLLRGLVSLSSIYQIAAKLSWKFSRAATVRVVRQPSANNIVIESRPISGIPERPYMCENRRGILAGGPLIFDLPFAKVHEIECFHRGAERCLYEVSWTSELPWYKLAIRICIAGGVGLGTAKVFGAITGLLTGIAGCFLILGTLMFKRLSTQRHDLKMQNEMLAISLNEIDRKNKQLDVIGEISTLAFAMRTPKEVLQRLVQGIVDLLGYDRAIVLTIEAERQILKMAACHGYSMESSELIKNVEFNIRPDNTSGFFIKVVNTGAPVLITDVEQELHALSARSQKFAKLLGSKSFVAVPLKDRSGTVTGVIAADYVAKGKAVTISDQDLLTTLAYHVGIAFQNAQMLKTLQENLDNLEIASKKETALRSSFQKFIPPDLVRSLAVVTTEAQQQQVLQGVRKGSCAIIFMDIFGFSRVTHDLAPERIIELLNIVFQTLTPAISKSQGFIDKFTGDGLLAVFEGPNCSANACSASLLMLAALNEANACLTRTGLPRIQMGIGIHYGPVILGTVGSSDRLNFTVIGDSVNVASRLESHTRNLGPNSICCSASVRKQAGDIFDWRSLGPIELKGFDLKLDAFQLLNQNRAEDSIQQRNEGI